MGQFSADDEEPTSELADIMQDVASQLPDDLYHLPPKEPDEIGSKLVDDADDFDLDLDLGFGTSTASTRGGDELLENSPESILQLGDGLDYEEPPRPAPSGSVDHMDIMADFASTMEAARPTPAPEPKTSAPAKTADKADHSDDDSFLEEEDDNPFLRLEEDLNMNKETNSGNVLPIAALVTAILALSTAGFATWQALSMQTQVSEIGTLASQPPKTEPDPRIPHIETSLGEISAKLDATGEKLNATQESISKQQEQLEKALKQEETKEKLNTIERELGNLDQRLNSSDKRLTDAVQEFHKKAQTIQMAETLPPRSSEPSVTPPPSVAAAVAPLSIKPETKPAPLPKPKPMPVPNLTKPSRGGWTVNLISLQTKEEVATAQKRLQKIGVFPRERKVLIKGRTWYRLYMDGFGNEAAAKQYIASLKGKPDLNTAWISREP